MNIIEKLKTSKVKYILVGVLVAALVFGVFSLTYAAETPLHDEAPGTIIAFSGKQWIVLEQMENGETYLILKEPDCERALDPDGTNLFDPTDSNNIAYYLNNDFYNDLSQKDLVAEHSWDRDGFTSYDGTASDNGNVSCKVGLLSYLEYKKYGNYYNGSILPRTYDYMWLTRSPCSNIQDYVWHVKFSGNLSTNNSYAYSIFSIRPALYLKSETLVDQNKVVVGEGSIGMPSPPTQVYANVESSTATTLTWQPNTEEDLEGYRIYRGAEQIDDVEKTYTTYTDNTVLPGTTYSYSITAYNTSNLESDGSDPVTATTPPATPTSGTGQALGKTVNLTWQAPGNKCYLVERSSDGTDFTQVAEVTQTTFSETAPLWETTYYYRVAQKGQDNVISDFSEPVEITTGPVPVPTDLTATIAGNNVNLSWQAVDGIAGYVIEKSTDNVMWETLATSDTNSYTDQVPDPNAEYFYRVRADGGNNQFSESSNVAGITTPPAAPGNLQAAITGKTVSLSWDIVDGATAYIVQRSINGTSFTKVAEVTETSHADTVPNWNTTYYYRVLSKNVGGLSSPSSTAQVKTAPAAPANLQATVSYNTVSLTWDASAGASSYTIQRSIEEGDWADIATAADTSYSDENLGWGMTFSYRVIAHSTEGLISEASSPVTATTANVPVPSKLTATMEGTDVTLSWQAAPHVTMYLIERSTDGQAWEFLVGIGPSTNYTDTGLDLSHDYYYRVKSDGGNQVSGPSNVVKVTTPLGPPSNLQASVSGKNVTLIWVGSGNATYIIERIDGEVWEQVVEVSEQTCKDIAPRWETLYQYRVLAKNSEGMVSEPSEPIQVTTSKIPVPGNLKTSVSKNSITVTWDAAHGISQYRIERSGNSFFWTAIADINDTTYTDSELEWETRYYYRVRALDGDQVSEPSEKIEAQTRPKPIPTEPRLAYSVDNTNIGLSWNYQDVSGYRVYVDDKLVQELPGNKTGYVFIGERGNTYKVRIEAYNIYGEASSTATIKVGQLTTPGAGVMAGDIAKNAGVVVGSMGGLLALALGIKGSGILVTIVRLILRG